MKRIQGMTFLAAASLLLAPAAGGDAAEPAIAGHAVKLDSQGKIIPWSAPAEKAYSEFLHRRWNFIKTKVPPSPGPAPRSDYPQTIFCTATAFSPTCPTAPVRSATRRGMPKARSTYD